MFDFVGEWKKLLIDAGAVKWNPIVAGKTVEQWLMEENAEFQRNPVQARSIGTALQYQRSKEAYRCLCDGDKPRFDFLIFI